MSNYDFLVIASLTEGLPITLLECCSIGLPFLTTDVGAISDILFKNYPYICNQDLESIILNIKKIINDMRKNKDALRAKIIKSSFLFKEKFNFGNFLKKIDEYIYNENILIKYLLTSKSFLLIKSNIVYKYNFELHKN